ncbi:MAG TPA: gamma-glutamyltransferase family protein [Caulobacteraceae bacterium]|jgi:gamma-glutamyltranspeptidase/glutathione hydrolase|nr:gamma-glutamyltransferase family protein [Caulobacteraceae bacterium]
MRLALAACLAAIWALPAAAQQAMVAAANPIAADAGLEILRAGGDAVDAAVAIQATLGLVEPQSSGVGGGAFMTYYDARTRKVTAYDGRETAPAGATPGMFLGADGKPITFSQAVLSGRSAGVPGAIAMLALVHKEHGRLAWKALFADGEREAANGFVVSPRLADYIAGSSAQRKAPDVAAYFTRTDGKPYVAGDMLKNPAYAATLRRIAEDGPAALLSGPIASAIVTRLAQEPLPGTMTLADLAAYRPHESPALCAPFRQWTVCEPDAPSGGVVTLEALGILDRTDVAAHGPADAQGWFLLAQAERLAYADDLQYVADPKFVRVPTKGLLDPTYLDARVRLIGDHAGPAPEPGRPAGAPALGPDATVEPGGTSSFTVVDRWGNVVSMTTTVESVFGDGRMVGGFMLNNQLTDFSFAPLQKSGAPVANAVGPGKRPRSSMAPAIVLDREGRFVAAVGSPGGLAIPSYVLKTLVGVFAWNLSVQEAINLPNLVALGDFYASEPAKLPPGVAAGLAAKGITVRGGFAAEGSGLHGIIVRNGRLQGGADPRREGVAKACCSP